MVWLAEQTLKLIDDRLTLDGGTLFKNRLRIRLGELKDAYRPDNNDFRYRMGASILGKKCVRQIWYDFRWFQKNKPSPQMLRLFNRGHLEEGRIHALLDSVGCTLYINDDSGKQFGFEKLGGLLGGRCDGVAVGIPDLPPDTPCLLECKTSSSKRFAPLKKNGVEVTRPEHFIQMLVYMKELRLRYALYLVVNKDNDELYGEIVEADDEYAEAYLDRAEQLILCTQRQPSRCSETPGFFICVMCDYRDVCHNDKAPEKNCRTCVSFGVDEKGQVICNSTEEPSTNLAVTDEQAKVLDETAQLFGCNNWLTFNNQ